MKSKAVLAVLGFAGAFALSLPAMAQKSTGESQKSTGESQKSTGAYYAGLTVGQSNSMSFCDQLGPTCTDRRDSWRLLGGYRFNRYFAVEAGFHNLGEAKDEDPVAPKNARARAADLVGIVSFPMGGDLSVYGLAGAYRGNLKGMHITGVTFSQSNNGGTFGMGLQWDYFAPIGLRAGWQVYRRMGGGAAISETNMMVWSIGAIYNFK